MSKTVTPEHRFSNPLNYDPDFTAEISAKMQIPERISLVERGMESAPYQPSERKIMQVPERIIVAGGNEHITAKETPLELRLESSLMSEPSQCVLSAPPNVLTVSEYKYPEIDTAVKPESNVVSQVTSVSNKIVSDKPTEKITFLHQQVNLLNRRVLLLERENIQRQQREVLLYSVGIAYFLIKGLMWLHRHL